MRISRSDVMAHLDQLGIEIDPGVRRRARHELDDPVDTVADASRLEALEIDVEALERWARARRDVPATDPDSHVSETDNGQEEWDTSDQGWHGGDADGADMMEESWDERDL
jgi:hypothetical protein